MFSFRSKQSHLLGKSQNISEIVKYLTVLHLKWHPYRYWRDSLTPTPILWPLIGEIERLWKVYFYYGAPILVMWAGAGAAPKVMERVKHRYHDYSFTRMALTLKIDISLNKETKQDPKRVSVKTIHKLYWFGWVFWHINFFLSLRVFGLSSSSLLLFPQRFARYVLRPLGVCRTREPSRSFELRPLLNPRGSSVPIPLAIAEYKC